MSLLNQYSAAEQQLIESRRDELSRLIELVSMQPHIHMVVGEPHSHWSFNFETAIVSAPINDLIEKSDDYCRGLALHEAAHATVTRLFDILNPAISQRSEYHALFNVIEDCRIETWMMARSPGATPWIQEYNEHLFTPMLNNTQHASLSAQYLSGVLARWWFKELPFTLDDEVIQAIKETSESIDLAIAAQPPRHIVDSEAYQQIYRQNRSLVIAYLRSDLDSPPSPFECLVRIRQLQMITEVVRGVFPVYDALLERDRQEGRGQQAHSELKDLLDQLRGHHLTISSGRASGLGQGGSQVTLDLDVDGEGMSGEERSGQGDPTAGQASASDQASGSSGKPAAASPELQEAIRRALSYDPHDAYLNTWRLLHREIDHLSDSLLEVLTARSKPRWVRGLSSGTRIDLREAMAFEADPRRYQSLWMSQKRPEKIDPALIIHIDISGSMDGERIRESFKGLVLLTEVCARLNLPLEVISFNQNAQLVRAWDEKIEDAQRERLAQLLKRVGGSTYYAKAINLTLSRLEELPFRDRFLIALSDGEPHDESEVTAGLAELARQGVYCVGLGIGPETSELKRFFNDGLYGVTPSEVAEELAQLLDRLLR